jgi:very-short-patch-repair endonuclease
VQEKVERVQSPHFAFPSPRVRGQRVARLCEPGEGLRATMKNDNPKVRHFARAMRKTPTPAEEALWRLLRNRRLAGFKFRRQHPFGPYILDGYCPRASIVVEADGDTHATPEGQESDRLRDEYLAANGVLVLRFWDSEITRDQDAVLERIATLCAERCQEK